MHGAHTAPAPDERVPEANEARIVHQHSINPLDVIERLRARYETIALVADTLASVGEYRNAKGTWARTVPPLTLADTDPSVTFWRGVHEFSDDLAQAERAIDAWLDRYGPAATNRRHDATATSRCGRVENDDEDDGLTDEPSIGASASVLVKEQPSASPLPTAEAKTSHVPSDLRSKAEVSAEIRQRIITATTALMAAWEAADATEDVDDECLRLSDVAFSAARGHNELRRLYVRIGTEWGAHPDIELAAETCAFLAAANACATFATGLDLLDETGPGYIENIASYRRGLEWIVKLLRRTVEAEFRDIIGESDECGQSDESDESDESEQWGDE